MVMVQRSQDSYKPTIMAVLAVFVSCAVLWSMTQATPSAAQNWLIIAWIILASAATAGMLNTPKVSRLACLVITLGSLAVALSAKLSGISEPLLLTPFFGLAFCFFLQLLAAKKPAAP